MKTGELAARLNVHSNTIRAWCDQYAGHLSKTTTRRASGSQRELTARDCIVLATVADLRNKGLAHDAIEASLQNGSFVESLPEAPTPEEKEARENIDLVPRAELHRAYDRIAVLELERDRLIKERDSAALDKDKANARIAELEREIGQAQGQLSERPPVLFVVRLVVVVIMAVVVVFAVLLAVLLLRGKAGL